MALRLQIENVSSLPDGGPLGITVSGRRGIDIGRDQHLDWSLPDPSRFISGKHCEVRYHDDSYWLHDVSTNGTFLNGSDEAMRAPHRLRSGDRVEIGPYVVAVEVDAEGSSEAPAESKGRKRAEAVDLWQVDDGNIAPPVREERRVRTPTLPPTGDFLDQRMGGIGPGDESFWASRTPSTKPAARTPLVEDDRAKARSRSIWDEEDRESAPVFRSLPPPEPSVTAPVPAPRPPPIPPAPAAPNVAPQGSSAPSAEEQAAFVKALAKGAEVPASLFARYSADELAELMGKLLRLSAENLKQLLSARSELKDIVRTSRTIVTTSDNNPLKLAPTLEEAMALMFAPASQSYLDAHATFQQSFRDLKHHQVQTFSAMQVAVSALAKDFEPRSIEAQVEPDRGFGAMVGSRKARLWDAYVARWQAKVNHHEDGLLGVFLEHFSEFYDRSGGKRT